MAPAESAEELRRRTCITMAPRMRISATINTYSATGLGKEDSRGLRRATCRPIWGKTALWKVRCGLARRIRTEDVAVNTETTGDAAKLVRLVRLLLPRSTKVGQCREGRRRAANKTHKVTPPSIVSSCGCELAAQWTSLHGMQYSEESAKQNCAQMLRL